MLYEKRFPEDSASKGCVCRFVLGMSRKQSGDTVSRVNFTLLDLLLVISIICILIALLLPVLAKAREMAKSTGCLNKVRQHGLAFSSYADDFDGFYPTSGGNSGASYQIHWTSSLPNGNQSPCQRLLERYGGYAERTGYDKVLPSSSLLVCPAADIIIKNKGNYSFYGLNLSLVDDYFGMKRCQPVSRIQFSSKTMLVTETGNGFWVQGRFRAFNGYGISFWHREKQNGSLFFVDGHAEIRNRNRIPHLTEWDGSPFYPGFSGYNTYFWSGHYPGTNYYEGY